MCIVGFDWFLGLYAHKVILSGTPDLVRQDAVMNFPMGKLQCHVYTLYHARACMRAYVCFKNWHQAYGKNAPKILLR